MNVTEELMSQYINVFNKTYIETTERFLPAGLAESLHRYPLLSGGIIGYVSTQFGAAIEYLGGNESYIKLLRSSSRIEDLFTGAPTRIRKTRPMFKIGGENITFANLTLRGAFPFRLTSDHASVRFISVRFEAERWAKEVAYAEIYSDRTVGFWSELNAVARAKDEVFLAFLDIKEAEKRSVSLVDYLSKFKERTVLVLGDYGFEGRKRLEEIKTSLEGLGYAPILLDEIPDDFHYSLPQKAVAVGSVVRFVVVDDSSKSGHLVEYSHAVNNRWVTIVLRYEGSDGSFMTRGESNYSKVVSECDYNQATMGKIIESAVQWAEGAISSLKEAGKKTYPWRDVSQGTKNDA